MRGSVSVEPLRFQQTDEQHLVIDLWLKSLLVDRHQGLLSLVLVKELAGMYSEGAIL